MGISRADCSRRNGAMAIAAPTLGEGRPRTARGMRRASSPRADHISQSSTDAAKMKLFRSINSKFDSNQPVIQWDGDLRGIIAAMRSREAADRGRQPRLRLVRRLDVRRTVQPGLLAPVEVAA